MVIEAATPEAYDTGRPGIAPSSRSIHLVVSITAEGKLHEISSFESRLDADWFLEQMKPDYPLSFIGFSNIVAEVKGKHPKKETDIESPELDNPRAEQQQS